MKKNVIIFGLTAGCIVSLLMVLSMARYIKGENFENGMLYGYASMLLAFSMIFVAVVNFRDKYNNGIISFGKAFTLGLYITLIASTMYVITWLIDYTYFIPDFGEKYAQHMMEELKKSGASEAELLSKASEMAEFNKMYKNPLFNAMLTYTEILPVGLLFSALAGLILKRKTKKTDKI